MDNDNTAYTLARLSKRFSKPVSSLCEKHAQLCTSFFTEGPDGAHAAAKEKNPVRGTSAIHPRPLRVVNGVTLTPSIVKNLPPI